MGALEKGSHLPLRVGPVFGTTIDSGVLYGTLDAPAPWGTLYPRATRAEAIAVPAIKRARDLIAGTIGQFPLQLIGPNGEREDWALFNQPEANVPPSVTLTQLVEDMLFEGKGWWRVRQVGWHNRPVQVIRLDPRSVSVQPETVNFDSVSGSGTATVWPDDPNLIRFDSPNDALLIASARAIRTLTRLEQAGLNAVEGIPPQDWFTPAEDADPFEDEDEVEEFLDGWAEARKKRRTAYIPAAVNYQTNAMFSPEQLQMAEARQHAVLEIARATGIDPEELSVSTTSRTYANIVERRRDFTELVLGPFMTAIESRLSMDDVTPRGYKVDFDITSFLRANDLTRAQTDVALINAGVIRAQEARETRGIAGSAPELPRQVSGGQTSPSGVGSAGEHNPTNSEHEKETADAA